MELRLRDIALGVILAVAGFSYALATSSTSEASSSAAVSRGAGSLSRVPLQFITPLLSGTSYHDLGDAAFGSQIVRWARARGGVPPLSYVSDHNNSAFPPTVGLRPSISLADAVKNLPASVEPDITTSQLLLTGRLQGQIGNVAASIGTVPLIFDVTVVDSGSGTNPVSKTETFQLTMVDANVFKFARDVLNSGVAFHPYFDMVDVIAGAPPFTYAISGPITLTDSSSNVIQINSVPTDPYKSLLNQMGLFLNTKTGRISGRPLLDGLLKIPLTCTDSSGQTALSRDKSSPAGQTVSINIAASNRVSTQIFSTAVKISGDTRTGGKDSIKYAGVLNIGDKITSLNLAKVTFSIGSYTAPSVILDSTGKGSTGKKGKGQVSLSVKVSSNGTFKITIGGESFGTQGSILSDITAQNVILPVVVTIGDQFTSSELLKFDVKARGTKFQLSYKFGPGNLGGGFLVTGVQGKDDKATAATAWKVAFIMLPPNPNKFGQAENAVVGVGTDFTDAIGLINGNGKIGTGEKRDPKSAQITKIGLVQKTGKGFVQTGPLLETSTAPDTQTSIPMAKETLHRTRFAFIVDFQDANGKSLFGGSDGVFIFSDGKSTYKTKQ